MPFFNKQRSKAEVLGWPWAVVEELFALRPGESRSRSRSGFTLNHHTSVLSSEKLLLHRVELECWRTGWREVRSVILCLIPVLNHNVAVQLCFLMSKFTKSEYRWLAAQRWRIWCPSSSQRCTDTSRSQQKSGWKTSAHLYHTRKHTTQTCTWAKEDLHTATVKPSWDIILPSFSQHQRVFTIYPSLYQRMKGKGFPDATQRMLCSEPMSFIVLLMVSAHSGAAGKTQWESLYVTG